MRLLFVLAALLAVVLVTHCYDDADMDDDDAAILEDELLALEHALERRTYNKNHGAHYLNKGHGLKGANGFRVTVSKVGAPLKVPSGSAAVKEAMSRAAVGTPLTRPAPAPAGAGGEGTGTGGDGTQGAGTGGNAKGGATAGGNVVSGTGAGVRVGGTHLAGGRVHGPSFGRHGFRAGRIFSGLGSLLYGRYRPVYHSGRRDGSYTGGRRGSSNHGVVGTHSYGSSTGNYDHNEFKFGNKERHVAPNGNRHTYFEGRVSNGKYHHKSVEGRLAYNKNYSRQHAGREAGHYSGPHYGRFGNRYGYRAHHGNKGQLGNDYW